MKPELKEGLISVIIPVYNVEPYLERCVDSVINQTYKNLEIILVDDGSTDGSGGICDAYEKKDVRIRVIHKKNGGLSSARNSGLKIARGEYIGFVDSDDYIALDMYALMQRHMRADVDIVSCATVQFNKRGRISKRGFMHGKLLLLDSVQALKEFLLGRYVSGMSCDKLYKKDVLNGTMFPVGRVSEDHPFVYSVIKNSRNIIHVGSCKYFYCYREDSISNRPFFKRRVDYVLFARDILKDIAIEYPMLMSAAEAKYVRGIMAIVGSIDESPDGNDYEYMRKRLVKAVRRMALRIIANSEMSYKEKIRFIAFR